MQRATVARWHIPPPSHNALTMRIPSLVQALRTGANGIFAQ